MPTYQPYFFQHVAVNSNFFMTDQGLSFIPTGDGFVGLGESFFFGGDGCGGVG